MALNINEIKSQLTFGGAKASHFQVLITNPVNSVADIKAPFMIQAASLPGSTLGFIDIPYFGRKIPIAGDRTFEDWTVTVMNDEDFLVRNAMEEWMAAINSHEGNVRQLASASTAEYKSQAQITQFSKTGIALREYTFQGIFPINVSPITTDWETTDDIERFDVTFKYDLWKVTGGVTGNASTDS